MFNMHGMMGCNSIHLSKGGQVIWELNYLLGNSGISHNVSLVPQNFEYQLQN